MRWTLMALCLACPAALAGQQAVTRADAVAVALARADTTAALGAARAARAFPNPTVTGSYSKDTPNYHALGDLPLDLPWLRSPRIGAAESARDAARYRFAFERAAIRFDVDTTYSRSLAAALLARLSHRTALDADSLLRIAELRRDVGDVSELDVRLAAVTAGQLANIAADSLRPPPDSALTEGRVLLPIAAAEASLRSAERSLAFARRSRFAPNLQFGFDTGDPTSATPHQLLPVVGFSFPFPLFNFGRGDVLRASAERDRARAQLDLTRRETGAAVARARRELVAARDRLRRTAGLVESANRVAAMSLQAYTEGAVPLANVLEAQRNAREILARYIDDLATADAAARALKMLTAPDEP